METRLDSKERVQYHDSKSDSKGTGTAESAGEGNDENNHPRADAGTRRLDADTAAS